MVDQQDLDEYNRLIARAYGPRTIEFYATSWHVPLPPPPRPRRKSLARRLWSKFHVHMILFAYGLNVSH